MVIYAADSGAAEIEENNSGHWSNSEIDRTVSTYRVRAIFLRVRYSTKLGINLLIGESARRLFLYVMLVTVVINKVLL